MSLPSSTEVDTGVVKRMMPFAAAACGVLTLAFLISLFRGAFFSVSDLPEFYAPAKMIASGHGAQIYLLDRLLDAEQAFFRAPSRGVIVLFAPPAGLPWIMPLALLPPNLAPDIWKGFLIVCVILGIFLLRSTFALNRVALCWLIAVICLSGCTYEALRIDQLSAVLFLGFSCALWALKSNRPYLAAFALSIFFMKPQQILPFVVFLLGARHYKCLGALLALFAVFSAAGVGLVGIDGLHNYSDLMQSTTEDLRYLTTQLSCTLRGQLVRISPQTLKVDYLIASAVSLLCCCWCFYSGRMMARSKHWLDYGLISVMPVGIATSLYCHVYDFLILMPTLIVLMSQFENDLPPLVVLLGLISAMTFMIPFSIFIHNDWLLTGHVINIHFFVLAMFSIGCIILFFAKLKKTVEQEAESSL